MFAAQIEDRVRHYPDIGAVLDARAVKAVFQPLVDLDTETVVGYEALARGPAGSRWESPEALFGAAGLAGRAAELDWVCRARAYQAALAVDLPPDLTLFVNTEPATLRSVCPPDLVAVVALAQGRLRVVTELTERAIAGDPSALLAAVATCRSVGWGVALDDVGADPASLAFMPFVHPDVVKLDMHLLHRPSEAHVASVVTAVLAYAERTGARILAEGIETPAHLRLARTMGATLGQGWLFGRPGPLPGPGRDSGALTAQIQLLTAPGAPDRTPYEIVAAARPVAPATKAHLMPISRYLEARARDDQQPPALLACFQQARHFTEATARRFTETARSAAFVAAVAVDLDPQPAVGVRGARLSPEDPLCDEWNVIVVGPHYTAALVALDLGDQGPDRQRRFSYAVTHDRELVLAAARSLLQVVAPLT